MSFRAHILLLAAVHVAVPMAAAQLLPWHDLRRSWLFVVLCVWAACLPALAVSYVSVDFPAIAAGAVAVPAVAALARLRVGLQPPLPRWLPPQLLPPPLARVRSHRGGSAADRTTGGRSAVASAALTAASGSASGASRGTGSGPSTSTTPSESKMPSVHSSPYSMRAASWSRISSMSGFSLPGRPSFSRSDTEPGGPAAVSCRGDAQEAPTQAPDGDLRWGCPRGTSPTVRSADDADLLRSYSASNAVSVEAASASMFTSSRTSRSGMPQHTSADSSIMTSGSTTLSELPRAAWNGSGSGSGHGRGGGDALSLTPAQHVFACLTQGGGDRWAVHNNASASVPLAIPRTQTAAAMLRIAPSRSCDSGDGGNTGSPLSRCMSPLGMGKPVPGAGAGGGGSPIRWPGGLGSACLTSSGGRSVLLSEPLPPHKEEEDDELQRLQDAMSEVGQEGASEQGSLSVASRAAGGVAEGREPVCRVCACQGGGAWEGPALRQHSTQHGPATISAAATTTSLRAARTHGCSFGCSVEDARSSGVAGAVSEAIEEWEEVGLAPRAGPNEPSSHSVSTFLA